MKTKLSLVFLALLFCVVRERQLMAEVGDIEDTWGWTTTQSTGVLVSSNAPIILRSVSISTLTVLNEYVVIVDSNPLAAYSTSAAGGFVADTTYPRSQWVTPKLMFVATDTFRGSDFLGSYYAPWGNEGVLLKNGLVVFQSAQGGTVTVVWRKPKR